MKSKTKPPLSLSSVSEEVSNLKLTQNENHSETWKEIRFVHARIDEMFSRDLEKRKGAKMSPFDWILIAYCVIIVIAYVILILKRKSQ